MGRWGDKIYESDAALDYFVIFTERIEREIVYLFAPEQIRHSTAWLTKVLGVVEIVLLFDQHEIGSLSLFSYQSAAVMRWEELFFNVWDAQWNEKKDGDFPYHAYAYRVEHRPIVIGWFKRLRELADYWSDLVNSPDLEPYQPEHPLPYFSLTHFRTADGNTHVIVDQFIGELIGILIRDVVFTLSDQNRALAIGFFEIEDVWVAVDVIGFLSETYQISPEVSWETVKYWQATMEDVWKARLAEENMSWTEDTELYKSIVVIFDRLKAVARQYPPWFAKEK